MFVYYIYFIDKDVKQWLQLTIPEWSFIFSSVISPCALSNVDIYAVSLENMVSGPYVST